MKMLVTPERLREQIGADPDDAEHEARGFWLPEAWFNAACDVSALAQQMGPEELGRVYRTIRALERASERKG